MKLFKRSSTTLFGSESIVGHLLRGAIGVLLIAWAIAHQNNVAWSLAAAAAALIAFRGCPVCWLVGLMETLNKKISLFRHQ